MSESGQQLWGCPPLGIRLTEARCQTNRSMELVKCRGCPGARELGIGPDQPLPRLKPKPPPTRRPARRDPPARTRREHQPERKAMAEENPKGSSVPPRSRQRYRFPCGHGRTGRNVRRLASGEKVCRRCFGAATPEPAAASIQAAEHLVEARTEPDPQPERTASEPAPLGFVRVTVSMEFGLDEIGDWEVERIAAFFKGLGQVMAAKGAEVDPGR